MWALIRMAPQSQERFVKYVAEYQPHIRVYFPLYNRIVRNPSGRDRKKQKLINVPTPVYPGYVFVTSSMESPSDGLPGVEVTRLVGCPVRFSRVKFGNTMGVVRNTVIEGLMRLELAGVLVTEKVMENPYLPGKVVRVQTPVMSIRAIVLGCTSSGNQVVVETAFSRMTVPLANVELTGEENHA